MKVTGHPTSSDESDDKTKSTPQRWYWKVHRLAKMPPAVRSLIIDKFLWGYCDQITQKLRMIFWVKGLFNELRLQTSSSFYTPQLWRNFCTETFLRIPVMGSNLHNLQASSMPKSTKMNKRLGLIELWFSVLGTLCWSHSIYSKCTADRLWKTHFAELWENLVFVQSLSIL